LFGTTEVVKCFRIGIGVVQVEYRALGEQVQHMCMAVVQGHKGKGVLHWFRSSKGVQATYRNAGIKD